MKASQREQKLVDLIFEFSILSAEYMHGKSKEDIANWVTINLQQCGFPTRPMGANWGVLQ